MDQFSFHSRQMLLEAVRSAEDAAIQLRQYPQRQRCRPCGRFPQSVMVLAGFPALY